MNLEEVKATGVWTGAGAFGEQVDSLLTQVFARIRVYYDRVLGTEPNLPSMQKALRRAWKVIDSNDDLAINKELYGYAAYSVTLQYPRATETRDLLASGTQHFGNHSFFEISPRVFGVDPQTLRRAVTWQLSMLDQILADLAVCPEERRAGILSMIVIGQFAPMIYMLQALPREEVRDNYLAYQRRVFYFGLSYVVDHIVDNPSIDASVKQQLDTAIEAVLSGRDVEFESDHKIVQLALKYLRAFSADIRGLVEEKALRVHLLAFHRIQRAAQGVGGLSVACDDINHLSTAKSFFSFNIVPLLFGRCKGPDYWDRLFPFATLAQLNDDIRDYAKDRKVGQQTPFTAYVASGKNADPLDLWSRVFTDLIRGGTREMKRSMAVLTIKIIGGNSLEQLQNEWPTKIGVTVGRLIGSVAERPVTYSCFSRQSAAAKQGVARGLDDAIRAFQTELGEHKQMVTNGLMQLCEHGKTPLHADMAYTLEGGKCGRSYLIKMIAEHYGVDPKKLLPFMLAVEMAQTSSLVFDDLPSQDNATLRRDKPCLHTKHPVYQAELAGISLLTEPFRIMSEWHIDPAIRVQNMALSAAAIGPSGLCYGQLMDLDESPRTFEDFVEMYALKTSNGFRIPLVGAAMACRAPKGDIQKLEILAYKLGIAYQIRDDLLESVVCDKKSERTARRILDVDAERATALFYEYRKDVFDAVFDLFQGEVRAKFLRVYLKLLLLEGESEPYAATRVAMSAESSVLL